MSNQLAEEQEREDYSLQYVSLKLYHGEMTVENVLEWMRAHGSSVLLNWGEDPDAWECSWITGGKRYTGCQVKMRSALLECLNKAFASTA